MPHGEPLTVSHCFFVSGEARRPPTENETHSTRINGFPHFFHGRGDSVSVNSIDAVSAFAKRKEFIEAMMDFVFLQMFQEHGLRDEINRMHKLGDATWDVLMAHPDNAPQWTMMAFLLRHMFLRPWIAYRVDVAAEQLYLKADQKQQRQPGQPREYPDTRCTEEKEFFEAAKALLNKAQEPPPFVDSIKCNKKSRSGLVFGMAFNLRTTVALSFSVESFDTAAYLADWMKAKWETDWSAVRVMDTTDDKPFLWMYGFGMKGESQVERQDWAKYSPFIYSLSPVLAHVPVFRNNRERKSPSGRDSKNTELFVDIDKALAQLAYHVHRCEECKRQVSSIHKDTQELWTRSDFRTDVWQEHKWRSNFMEDIGLETVCLLDHMRIWPVIERLLAMHKNRLMFSPHGWKLVYSTFCLGSLALRLALQKCSNHEACSFKTMAVEMLQKVGLLNFKAIVRQLGNEAQLSVPIFVSETENRGVPAGRIITKLNFESLLKKGISSDVLAIAQPALTGVIPTVQFRGERYDRKFLMLFSAFEPNLYDHAVIGLEPDTAHRLNMIKDLAEGFPNRFHPREYISNWLDNTQVTNFDHKLNQRSWYVSRLAPGIRTVDDVDAVAMRVSTVLVGKVKEMFGSQNLPNLAERRLDKCLVLPLLSESLDSFVSSYNDVSSVFSNLEPLPQIGKSKFIAVLLSSCSMDNVERTAFEYELRVAVARVRAEDTLAAEPLFCIEIVGKPSRCTSGTVVSWSLPGEARFTGSISRGNLSTQGPLRAVPLVIEDGVVLSLVFLAETTTAFESSPRNHVPFPIVASQDWCPEWQQTDIRVPPTVGSLDLRIV